MPSPSIEPMASPRSVEDRPRNVLEHLEELRRRLWVCVMTVGLAAGAGFGLGDRLMEWLIHPASAVLPRLAFFHPTDALTAYLSVAIVFGLVAASPVVLYQVWAFVRSGLTWRERYYGFMLVSWGTGLFALGAAIAYGVVLPIFLKFLLSVGGPQLEPVISINAYLSFVLGTMVICGLLCELPLAIVLLTRLGVVTPALLRRQRRLAVLAIAIISALVTPTTDAVTMGVVAIPLLGLYELSVWIAGRLSRPAA